MHPNTAAALKAGRDRWLERLRAAKASGLIERFPNGRRRKEQPKLSSDKRVRRAQRIVEMRLAMVEKAGLPAKPWSEMSRGEKLASNADDALRVAQQILALGVDPADPRTLALVKDTALATIAMQIRVEAAGKGPPAEPALPDVEAAREVRIIVRDQQAADEFREILEGDR